MSKRKKKRTIRDLDAAPTDPPAATPTQRTTGASRSSPAARSTADDRPNRSPETNGSKNFFAAWWQAADRFWFSRRAPKMLGIIRLLTGAIALYTLAVWTLELSTFFAADGVLPPSYRSSLGAAGAWSHLDWGGRWPPSLLATHIVSMIVVLLFAVGVFTRITAVLAAAIIVGYGNRCVGAGFGLDQILTFLCLYCAVGNSGGAFSVDRWLAQRRSPSAIAVPDTTTNIAIRLIQIHLCTVYFFAAIAKLQGTTWWNGKAVWLAMSSYEYQQVDMTWLAHHLTLVSAMSLLSLFWEISYSALIWPRLTRPLVLAVAVPLHLGIGVCLGMIEFGLIMLVANLAFVDFSIWPRRSER